MPSIDFLDWHLVPAMSEARLAGIIRFLSPCVLRGVPPYLACMPGMTINEVANGKSGCKRVIITAAFFVMGLGTLFLILGFAASAFGAFFLTNQILFAQIQSVVIMTFGLHFLSVFRIPFPDRQVRVDAIDQRGSFFGACVPGLAFAFGWTPWIGPQLGTILSLSTSEASVGCGTFLPGVYAAGPGIPFLLSTFG